MTVTPKNFLLLHTFLKNISYSSTLCYTVVSIHWPCLKFWFDALQFLHASNTVNLFNVHRLRTDLTFQETPCNKKPDELKIFHKVACVDVLAM